MSEQMKIYCVNLERYIDIQGGEKLVDIARTLDLPFEPICARVNNKTESLLYQVFAPKQVEFLDKTSPSGSRTYVRSLCMVLYRRIEPVSRGAAPH